ncbi:MAG: ATP-binding cassette domain-containing protein, partial [Variovorax sp.]
MPNALELTGIRKSFDGFAALTDAHFAARWGEVHALLGENGAGKSSLMNIAAGLYAPEVGQLLVDDNAVRFAGPRDAAKHRIGMVHQHFKLVRPFTVAQNILLTAPPPAEFQSHGERLREIERDIRNKASELGFDIDPSKRIDALSIAEQQRVEILKVLLAGARILILDEPTAVLTDQEASRLLQTVRGLARAGAAVVLVTHKMADVKTYADRVTVMRGGCTVATLRPNEASVAELVKLTVGESIAMQGFQASTISRGPVRLSVRGLRTPASPEGRRVLDGVDLELHAGEIYGLAGVGGNGQGELAGAIMGLPGEATEGE